MKKRNAGAGIVLIGTLEFQTGSFVPVCGNSVRKKTIASSSVSGQSRIQDSKRDWLFIPACAGMTESENQV
jgi:hypothetical protein